MRTGQNYLINLRIKQYFPPLGDPKWVCCGMGFSLLKQSQDGSRFSGIDSEGKTRFIEWTTQIVTNEQQRKT